MTTKEHIVTKLAAQRERIERWYAGLNAAELARPVTPSEVDPGNMWTSQDHLAHVLGTERFFQGAIKRALAGADDPLGFYTATGTDDSEPRRALVNQTNERSVLKYRSETAEAIFGRLDETRAATLALLNALDDAQLAQTVPHSPFGDATVGALFLVVAGHGQMHMDWLAKAAEATASDKAES